MTKHLIEQYWSNDPNERQTFDEIYNKLSNCQQNSNSENISEENYLLDDMNQLSDYINEIANEPNPFENILVKKILFLNKKINY